MSIHSWLLCFIVATCNAYEKYEGYTVLQVVPTTEQQLQDISRLAQDERFQLMYQADFWLEPSTVNRPIHVMVPPQSVSFVTMALESFGMDVTDYISDVSVLIEAEQQRLRDRPETLDFDYDNWNTFDVIMDELEVLQSECPDGVICEVFDIGSSLEGRPMRVFKMSLEGEDRRAFWIDSLIHAREWIAGGTMMRILDTMVRGKDAVVDRFLTDYDWYFLPVMNPDGYSYTHTDDRLWRKNRSINSGSSCIGTDLNRNYAYLWGGVGSSSNPCTETYGGDSAASEPATQAIQAYMSEISTSLEAWITLHSYSQYWLIPWGDRDGVNCVIADDHDDMMVAANAAADASEAAEGDTWDRGNWCQVLYGSTGILQDHAKEEGIKYTFTPELRDDGYGFSPPPTSIEPSYQEVWEGIKAMVSAIETIRSRN